ncbi:MAG: hypothetical protein F6J87_30050 [Spirulina sp. SIO3F2]|nr:hypothetical protein [Spirulina sp. SIO3F2]
MKWVEKNNKSMNNNNTSFPGIVDYRDKKSTSPHNLSNEVSYALLNNRGRFILPPDHQSIDVKLQEKERDRKNIKRKDYGDFVYQGMTERDLLRIAIAESNWAQDYRMRCTVMGIINNLVSETPPGANPCLKTRGLKKPDI